MDGNTASMTDGELIERIGRSDHRAFEALYRRHASRVLGLATRRLRDRGRAEDATQEAFAAIWRSARSFRPGRGSGTTWLYTVARNAIIDRARRNRTEFDEVPELTFDGPGPDSEAEASWVSEAVHHAVSQLPEKEREVIALAYWSELSQSEVAARLGVPLGTVKTRTRSALNRLAHALEAEHLL